MNIQLTFALSTIGFALLTGCASSPITTDAQNVKTVDITNGIGVDGVPAPMQRSIYFGTDQYTLNSEGQDTVNNHSVFLKKNRQQHVLIQGNTDERGTSEYNLALGQRRSEAVRNAMAAQEVGLAQMEAVSLGEEHPKAIGNDESAWSQNRRVDLVY